MSTTHESDRFTALPDDETLAATVVALEGHGFGVVESGLASGEVRGTPTLFIDGKLHLGGNDAASLMEALAG